MLRFKQIKCSRGFQITEKGDSCTRFLANDFLSIRRKFCDWLQACISGLKLGEKAKTSKVEKFPF